MSNLNTELFAEITEAQQEVVSGGIAIFLAGSTFFDQDIAGGGVGSSENGSFAFGGAADITRTSAFLGALAS